jgi:type IV secretory pathway TrbF-like protein
MDTPAQQPADISKRTLIMLVLLSCIISLVGTVAMIYQFSVTSVAPTVIENDGAANAQAGFTINGHDAPAEGGVGATGFATFTIGE